MTCSCLKGRTRRKGRFGAFPFTFGLRTGTAQGEIEPEMVDFQVFSSVFKPSESCFLHFLARNQSQVDLKVGESGLYVAPVLLGTPPQEVWLQLDTGSAWSWVPTGLRATYSRLFEAI